MERLEKCLKYIVIVILAFIIGILCLMSIAFTEQLHEGVTTFFNLGPWYIEILALVIVPVLVYFIKNKCGKFLKIFSSKKLVPVVTVINFIVMFLWIFTTQLKPEVDQESVMNAASGMLNGVFDKFLPGAHNYLYIYPFQNGIVLFYYFVSAIIGGDRYIALQFLNIPFLLLALFAIYRICTKIFSEKMSRVVYLMMPFWVPFTAYITFIYGVIIGFSFAMLAIMFSYDYFEKRKWYFACLSVLFMALSVVIKSNYLIFAIALMLIYIADLIHTGYFKNLIVLVAMIIAIFAMQKGTDLIVKNITGIETARGIPKSAWIAMGMSNDEACGWWDGYNIYVYGKHNMDYEATDAESKKYVTDRIGIFIRSPRIAAKFFSKKISSMWCNPGFEWQHIQYYRQSDIKINAFMDSMINNGTVGKIINFILDIMQTLIYAGTLCWLIINRKNIELKQLIFGIMFIGGFLFQLFWEAKCQYTIYYFYLLIPYAVMSLKDIGKKNE